MSSTELQALLRQAIESAKSGEKGRARALLIEITEADPNNEVAWMWRASLSLTPKDAAWCLTKVLRINPANRQAQEWLDQIRQLQGESPAVTRSLVPPSPGLLEHPGSTEAYQPTSSTAPSTPDSLTGCHPPHSATPATSPNPASWSAPPQRTGSLPTTPTVFTPHTTPPTSISTELTFGKTGEIERSNRPELPPEAKVILAVDDSLMVRRAITRTLESNGYRVITAVDGYEALSKLKEITPDLVILDVALPGGMDGYQLCKHIRAEKSRRGIPVIMLSDRESLLDKVQSRLAGATQYLTKPFKTEELLLSVRRHLKE